MTDYLLKRVPDMPDGSVRSEIIYANGQRYHIVSAGDGPLVLLLHGWPEFWYSWRHQFAPLTKAGYRVVAPDLRGFGRTSKPSELADYRVTEIIEDLVAIVDAMGEDQAIVVGHDWGSIIAWSAAWTRPDIFRAVVGISVPFGGRGQMALPHDPLGASRPSKAAKALSGDNKRFYHELFIDPAAVEREINDNMRTWLLGSFYSSSGSPALPEGASWDLDRMSDEEITEWLRNSHLCMPKGAEMRDLFVYPDELPEWLSEEDLNIYVEEFERTGISTSLNYYRNLDLNWEVLAKFEGEPVRVPAMFIGGDRDIATIWGRRAIKGFASSVPHLRESVILQGCGHWITQEAPGETSDALVRFLEGLREVDEHGKGLESG